MCNIWPNSLIVSQRFITTIFSRYITCILTIVLLTGIMRYMFYHCITLNFAKYNTLYTHVGISMFYTLRYGTVIVLQMIRVDQETMTQYIET